MSDKATIEAHMPQFLPGDKVHLHRRVGDVPAAGGTPVKSATVRRDGRVKFEALEPGPYFLIGTTTVIDTTGGRRRKVEVERSEAINAKVVPDSGLGHAAPGVHPHQIADGEFAAQMRQQTHKEIVTGARTTRDARGHVPPTDALAHPDEAQLTSEKGAVLASDTHAGAAVEASSPPLQQEDVPPDVVQASSTETGTASPLPGELEKVAKRAARNARARRRRAATAKSEEQKAAARSAASKKAAATRKRNAKAGVQSGRTGSAEKAQRENAGQGAMGRAAQQAGKTGAARRRAARR